MPTDKTLRVEVTVVDKDGLVTESHTEKIAMPDDGRFSAPLQAIGSKLDEDARQELRRKLAAAEKTIQDLEAKNEEFSRRESEKAKTSKKRKQQEVHADPIHGKRARIGIGASNSTSSEALQASFAGTSSPDARLFRGGALPDNHKKVTRKSENATMEPHPQSAPPASLSKPSQPTLMGVPTEVRMAILRNVLVANLPIDITANPDRPNHNLEPQALRVCKQLHTEGAEILYRENNLKISCPVHDQDDKETPLRGYPVLFSIRFAPMIRTLTLEITSWPRKLTPRSMKEKGLRDHGRSRLLLCQNLDTNIQNLHLEVNCMGQSRSSTSFDNYSKPSQNSLESVLDLKTPLHVDVKYRFSHGYMENKLPWEEKKDFELLRSSFSRQVCEIFYILWLMDSDMEQYAPGLVGVQRKPDLDLKPALLRSLDRKREAAHGNDVWALLNDDEV